MLSVGTVVVGVNDIRRAVTFWSQALGYVPPRRGGPRRFHGTRARKWARHKGGPGAERIAAEYPRIHLDLYAGDAADQAAEVERLVSLGAERMEWGRYLEDADFVVLADPEGNRFCVIDTGGQGPAAL